LQSLPKFDPEIYAKKRKLAIDPKISMALNKLKQSWPMFLEACREASENGAHTAFWTFSVEWNYRLYGEDVEKLLKDSMEHLVKYSLSERHNFNQYEEPICVYYRNFIKTDSGEPKIFLEVKLVGSWKFKPGPDSMRRFINLDPKSQAVPKEGVNVKREREE
jgi:hypothetical protein